MISALGTLAILAAATATAGTDGGTFYRPYAKPEVDLIYNLVFCDDPQLFVPGKAKPTGPLAIVLSTHSTSQALQAIASDEAIETRVRILAYNQLRAGKASVRRGQLLGVVVEVALAGGLDTLAVFADGRMRYINHSGKLAVIEVPTAAMSAKRDRLMKAANAAIGKVGPWNKKRLPPPTRGNVRLTFLVSDGLYFGEGPQHAIAQDAIGGPVLGAAAELLVTIVDASTGPRGAPGTP